MAKPRLQFDDIGAWSELKLEIVRKYASAYTTILSKQALLEHYYIDGFAGMGAHRSRATGAIVPGSPLNALQVDPQFKRYFFIDLRGDRVSSLRAMVGNRNDVEVMEGDANRILVEKVFPQARYEDYRRALCLLDPYGLHLDWTVTKEAGRMRSIDLILNFPMMDMNRNALWSNPEGVDPEDLARMTAFWGDETWREVAYRPRAQGSLFNEQEFEKASNQAIAEAFKERLRTVAGFRFVPDPVPMRNSANATLYYLFFASHNKTANKIATDILRAHRKRAR